MNEDTSPFGGTADVETIHALLVEAGDAGLTVESIKGSLWMSLSHVVAVLGELERIDFVEERGGRWFAA